MFDPDSAITHVTQLLTMGDAYKVFKEQYNKDHPEGIKSPSYYKDLNDAWEKYIEETTILTNI